MLTHRTALLGLLLVFDVSCAKGGAGAAGGEGPAGGEVVKSSAQRADPSGVPAADVQTQSQNDAAFAFQLYGQLAPAPGNLFFSPYSISSALAMVWAGANGDTATALSAGLDFSMPAPRVHAAFNALDAAFASRAQAGTGANGGPFALDVANALWAQEGLALQAPFLDTLAVDYGAGVHLEPFATAPEPARADINQWVSDNTSARIPMLLGEGSITMDTRFVLTNAVYFSGSWQTPFVKSATAAATFHALDGSTPSVQMMQGTFETAGAQGNGFTIAELPYSNPDLTLTLIVPDAGQFEAIESQLSAAFFAQAVASEGDTSLVLSLPKFTASTQASLKAPLTALGMGVAFLPGADFSGIDGAHDLSLSDVVHQANVTIDEDGTEAAAATAVVGGTSVALMPLTLVVDRPFILALRDVPTGSILFLGRISTP